MFYQLKNRELEEMENEAPLDTTKFSKNHMKECEELLFVERDDVNNDKNSQ